MGLPDPLPDNPQRWDGWKHYNSPNYYDRLCLDFAANATDEQIENHCRLLLVWWQKKLPLKNQPSNPLSQLLRGGLDEAPVLLAEARTMLLNPEARAKLDAELRVRLIEEASGELKKIIQFAFVNRELTEEAESRLYETGRDLGLAGEDIAAAISEELERMGFARAEAPLPEPPAPEPPPAPVEKPAEAPVRDPFVEFRRLLEMSRLALDGEEMSDSQRDAMCNLGEGLGLTGGEAEDLIDEYLEKMSGFPTPPLAAPRPVAPPRPAVSVPAPASSVTPPPRPSGVVMPRTNVVMPSAAARAQERQAHANFTNRLEMEMNLISTGVFTMGAAGGEATPQEQPLTRVEVSGFYLARFPVTNAQYERFDPTHRKKRAPWADETHPVVYVTSREAEKFCQWLSAQEGRKYRLPTEAEWEYAARGYDGTTFPWGNRFDSGEFANFADLKTTFPWRNLYIDDGFAETAPVGSYPRGASPFGIEDLAGNVFEWCLDFFEPYRGRDVINRRGPTHGTQRIYRGGSWRSKSSSLRGSARAFNSPDYSSNDVGFRVVCEVA